MKFVDNYCVLQKVIFGGLYLNLVARKAELLGEKLNEELFDEIMENIRSNDKIVGEYYTEDLSEEAFDFLEASEEVSFYPTFDTKNAERISVFERYMKYSLYMQVLYLQASRIKKPSLRNIVLEHLSVCGSDVLSGGHYLIGLLNGSGSINAGAEARKRKRITNFDLVKPILSRFNAEPDKEKRARLKAEFYKKTGTGSEKTFYNYKKLLTVKSDFTE